MVAIFRRGRGGRAAGVPIDPGRDGAFELLAHLPNSTVDSGVPRPLDDEKTFFLGRQGEVRAARALFCLKRELLWPRSAPPLPVAGVALRTRTPDSPGTGELEEVLSALARSRKTVRRATADGVACACVGMTLAAPRPLRVSSGKDASGALLPLEFDLACKNTNLKTECRCSGS